MKKRPILNQKITLKETWSSVGKNQTNNVLCKLHAFISNVFQVNNNAKISSNKISILAICMYLNFIYSKFI